MNLQLFILRECHVLISFLIKLSSTAAVLGLLLEVAVIEVENLKIRAPSAQLLTFLTVAIYYSNDRKQKTNIETHKSMTSRRYKIGSFNK